MMTRADADTARRVLRRATCLVLLTFVGAMPAGRAAGATAAETASAPGVTTNAQPSFIRFVEEGAKGGRVETAVKEYTRADGVVVTLFGAVHVADKAYYDDLQQRFTSCDALLYEMVRDNETPPEARGATDNPVSQMQIGMKRLLELEFQLEAMDYTPTNFVHADLDPETFFRLQQERRESLIGLMVRAMLAEQNRPRNSLRDSLASLQLLWGLMSPERGYSLKMVLGRQMEQMESVVAGIDQGPDGQGSVLVSARNEHAMKVLEGQIAKGHRKLGIFYGAAHMPDFERRLQRLGFRPHGEDWLTAWEIRPRGRPAAPSAEEGPGAGPP